ncbi:DedA family protein [Pokkaliibacter sp. MBI-7]|uniref:DedA family protein n=1 Tax=Pokkaliibacter sp. MBI-7 TaxID=3040600 RepID=UPI00244CC120|nr:DedA family protein [Pokkaliibacter sp. MBI-7]MDH2432774.1 DedA family protein [Pokkaliibacter sp. MBI-7]
MYGWEYWVGHYGYLAIAIGTLLEGETVLVLAGLAISQGQLLYLKVILLSVICSFIGDQFWFWLGRRYGDRLIYAWPRLQPRVERMQRLISRYHAPVIIVNRFLYGLRALGPALFGTTPLPLWVFVFFNLVGAVIWSMVVVGVGMGLHEFWSRFAATLPLALVAVLCLIAVVLWWRRGRRQRAA